MRPIPYNQVVKAVQISGAIPKVHGAPLHIGDPSVIGIEDISKPDFGDPVDIHEGEVPVFWACGVTPAGRGHELQASLRHHACARMHADNRHKERRPQGIGGPHALPTPIT